MRLSGLEKRCMSAASCTRLQEIIYILWYDSIKNVDCKSLEVEEEAHKVVVLQMPLMPAIAEFHVNDSSPSPKLDMSPNIVQLGYVSWNQEAAIIPKSQN